MFLWFVGAALVLVWIVFHDPAFDHRVLIVGALLPDLVDAPFGGARVAHTLLASAAVLVAVMLATRSRRHARRRWLALPIGMMVHLAVDDVWERAELFLWPLLGALPADPLPSLDQSVALIVLKELLGAFAVVWFVRRFVLLEPANRARFLQSGRLPREQAA